MAYATAGHDTGRPAGVAATGQARVAVCALGRGLVHLGVSLDVAAGAEAVMEVLSVAASQPVPGAAP